MSTRLPEIVRAMFLEEHAPTAVRFLPSRRPGMPGAIEAMGRRPLNTGGAFVSLVSWLDPTETESVHVNLSDQAALLDVVRFGYSNALCLLEAPSKQDEEPAPPAALEATAQAALWSPVAGHLQQFDLQATLDRLGDSQLARVAYGYAAGRLRDVSGVPTRHELRVVLRNARNATELGVKRAMEARYPRWRAAQAAAVEAVRKQRDAEARVQWVEGGSLNPEYKEWQAAAAYAAMLAKDANEAVDVAKHQDDAAHEAALAAHRTELYGPRCEAAEPELPGAA